MASNPPPLPGEIPPDEPHITQFGRFFSESEFVRANRHNRLRWIMSMGLGIPALVILAAFFSFLVAIAIGMAVIPSIYVLATQMFPGSKKHGTALYDRYKSLRSVAIRDFERGKA